MSRFEKFQNKQVCDEKEQPLYGQIIVHDCIINFENGFISNWDNEAEGEKDCPAIDCIDGHIEFWENGVLNKEDGPAVDSAALERFEFWKNGKLEEEGKYYEEVEELLKKNDREAELAFAKHLKKNAIPFIYLDQLDGEVYSAVLKEKNIKPNQFIVIGNEPFLILNNKDAHNLPYYFYPKSLLKDIIKDNINIDELKKICSNEKQKDEYDYCGILEKFFKDNNYTVK